LSEEGDGMNHKLRWSKELKHVAIHVMGYTDSPEKIATMLHNEFCDNPTELPNSKLLKEIIRLLRYIDSLSYGYYGYSEGIFLVLFIEELNKQMEWSGVKVDAIGGTA